MKTCKVRPTASDCRKCIDREEVLGVAIRASDTDTTRKDTKSWDL